MEQISIWSRQTTKKWHKAYKTKKQRIYMNINDKSQSIFDAYYCVKLYLETHIRVFITIWYNINTYYSKMQIMHTILHILNIKRISGWHRRSNILYVFLTWVISPQNLLFKIALFWIFQNL